MQTNLTMLSKAILSEIRSTKIITNLIGETNLGVTKVYLNMVALKKT